MQIPMSISSATLNMRLQTVRIFQKIHDIQCEMYKCESVNQQK